MRCSMKKVHEQEAHFKKKNKRRVHREKNSPPKCRAGRGLPSLLGFRGNQRGSNCLDSLVRVPVKSGFFLRVKILPSLLGFRFVRD